MTRTEFNAAVDEHGPHLDVRFKDGSEVRGSVFEREPDGDGVLLEGQPWRLTWIDPRNVQTIRRNP